MAESQRSNTATATAEATGSSPSAPSNCLELAIPGSAVSLDWAVVIPQFSPGLGGSTSLYPTGQSIAAPASALGDAGILKCAKVSLTATRAYPVAGPTDAEFAAEGIAPDSYPGYSIRGGPTIPPPVVPPIVVPNSGIVSKVWFVGLAHLFIVATYDNPAVLPLYDVPDSAVTLGQRVTLFPANPPTLPQANKILGAWWIGSDTYQDNSTQGTASEPCPPGTLYVGYSMQSLGVIDASGTPGEVQSNPVFARIITVFINSDGNFFADLAAYNPFKADATPNPPTGDFANPASDILGTFTNPQGTTYTASLVPLQKV